MTKTTQTTPKNYALFKEGLQISKAHSTRSVCVIEAFERGAIVAGYKDFISDPGPWRTVTMANGYEIKETV